MTRAGCGLVPNDSFVESRVVQGRTAGDLFPWTVIVAYIEAGAIHRHGTGALITSFHVLTAAHLVPK